MAKLGIVAVANTKMMVMPMSRILSAISLGVFWRSAPSTRPIMRSRKVDPGAAVMRTRIQSEMHLRAARDRRAVAAGLADHRRRLSGDRCLVDGGDALDHLAIGGDDVAGFDQHDVANLEAGARDELVVLGVRRASSLACVSVRCPPQRVCLRLAAALGYRFREVGKQHGDPQPQHDLEGEGEIGPARKEVTQQDHGRQRGHDLDHEHHRVLDQSARIELGERRADRRDDDLGIGQCGHGRPLAKHRAFHGYELR